MATTEKAPRGLGSSNDLKKLAPLQRKLQRMIDNKKYLERKITLAGLAHDLASNRTYLSDLVHQQYGMTFSDLINHLRVKEAEEILYTMGDGILIKDLYRRLGYSSSTSFYRNFKRITGYSTTDYLEKCKREKAEQGK